MKPHTCWSSKLTGLILLVCVLTACATWLEWDYNPEPEVIGYRVYIGDESRVYGQVVDVGNTNRFNLDWIYPNGLKFLAVTAYDSNGLEGEFSQEIVWQRPGAMVITVRGNGPGMIDKSLDLMLWDPFIPIYWSVPMDTYIPIDTNIPHLFYRFIPRTN